MWSPNGRLGFFLILFLFFVQFGVVNSIQQSENGHAHTQSKYARNINFP